MNRWPDQIKKEARLLRKRNLSYSQITKRLGIPKSTLHQWIYDLKRPKHITEEQKRKHLEEIRPLARAAIKKEREERLDKIKKNVAREVNGYPVHRKDFLKSVLSMLYWAEGTKARGSLQFANTDPRLILLFMTLLRRCYKIDESKIRVRLHLHYYHKIAETRKFWSSLLDIPQSKFGKIYIKPRSKTKKFRHNFRGICFIRYHSENLRYEILEKAYSLADRIAKYAPVA